MQRAAVLIVSSGFSIGQLELRLKALPGALTIKGDTEAEIKVMSEEARRSYVFVTLSSRRALAIEEYADNDELNSDLRSILPECEFVVLLCNSLDLLKSVVRVALEYAAELGDAWFDDDYGHVLKAQAVLARLGSEPEWDLVDREA